MPKAKKSGKNKKFDYTKDRKKLKKQFIKKNNPRIENRQIRDAWDSRKSSAMNLLDMGLAFDPNRSLPIKTKSLIGDDRETKTPSRLVTKPYVVNQLEEEANLPTKDTKTLSSDLIEYVQYMIREHNDDFKAMARDEKNYYQDTPKQIKRKINEYKRCHSAHGPLWNGLDMPAVEGPLGPAQDFIPGPVRDFIPGPVEGPAGPVRDCRELYRTLYQDLKRDRQDLYRTRTCIGTIGTFTGIYTRTCRGTVGTCTGHTRTLYLDL